MTACVTAVQSSTDVCTGQDIVEQLSSNKQVNISENFAHELQRIHLIELYKVSAVMVLLYQEKEISDFSSHFLD